MQQPKWFLDLLDLKDTPANNQEVSCYGQKFIMIDNILRANETISKDQAQTKDIFGFKWQQRDTFESDVSADRLRTWLNERYGDFNDLDFSHLNNKKITVLDAGCGAGFAGYIYFKRYFDNINYIGADISEAIDVAKDRSSSLPLDCAFLQSDLNKLPIKEQSVDVVFSEGVLHHTDSTEQAFANVAKLVKKDGYIMFYVYREKGPIREFTDDYVREKMQNLSPQEGWEAMEPLTKLGKVLGDLNIEIDVPENIDLLDIPAGKINLQRLVYWHVMKAFYLPGMTLDEMNHINFDWYAPKNAYRHTIDEIHKWCEKAGFIIQREREEDSGITIVAKKL